MAAINAFELQYQILDWDIEYIQREFSLFVETDLGDALSHIEYNSPYLLETAQLLSHIYAIRYSHDRGSDYHYFNLAYTLRWSGRTRTKTFYSMYNLDGIRESIETIMLCPYSIKLSDTVVEKSLHADYRIERIANAQSYYEFPYSVEKTTVSILDTSIQYYLRGVFPERIIRAEFFDERVEFDIDLSTVADSVDPTYTDFHFYINSGCEYIRYMINVENDGLSGTDGKVSWSWTGTTLHALVPVKNINTAISIEGFYTDHLNILGVKGSYLNPVITPSVISIQSPVMSYRTPFVNPCCFSRKPETGDRTTSNCSVYAQADPLDSGIGVAPSVEYTDTDTILAAGDTLVGTITTTSTGLSTRHFDSSYDLDLTASIIVEHSIPYTLYYAEDTITTTTTDFPYLLTYTDGGGDIPPPPE